MRKSPCRLVIYRSIALEYSQSPAIVPTHAYVRAAGRRWRRAHGVQLAQTGRLASSSPSTAVFVHHALTYRLFLARRSSLSSSQNRKPHRREPATGTRFYPGRAASRSIASTRTSSGVVLPSPAAGLRLSRVPPLRPRPLISLRSFPFFIYMHVRLPISLSYLTPTPLLLPALFPYH